MRAIVRRIRTGSSKCGDRVWHSWRSASWPVRAAQSAENARATNKAFAPASCSTPPPSRSAVKRYSLSHPSDDSLLRGLAALVAQDRITTADMLAHIADPSMFLYCVQELRLSEDAAAKRIQAGVLKLALKELVTRLEKRKFAATDRPRPP